MKTFNDLKKEIEKFFSEKNISISLVYNGEMGCVYKISDRLYILIMCDSPTHMLWYNMIIVDDSEDGLYWSNRLDTPYQDTLNEYFEKKEDVIENLIN
jgi:predicted transcriptional regulator